MTGPADRYTRGKVATGSAMRKDDDGERTYFRSDDRVFKMNGQW
ncbi:MAG: hypothetical protein QF921_05235 [Pseudomonadales bacterium]|jgi:hypothetical protein|nr:hypothetical protein [Pseudomonadales bacterium]MDP6471914.1 hypothetical protein [Pseudomonadales bacterium]MDP6826816.1 hypothetical protein [Pseudomonadales bacterium]MDP6970906.1 hypothetical protein [Pseudomonadales bacterium]